MTAHRGKDGTAFEEVAPDASAMIESMRAYGYSLPAAIADIVDNSIAADARNVDIHFEWNGAASWVSITDDGAGMTDEALRDAMRLGSSSPVDARDPSDLGRFGLGMKTASLSQCRRLTVVSRMKGFRDSVRRWDLDHLARQDVSGWQLLKTAHPEAKAIAVIPPAMSKGTRVLWEVLDRMVGNAYSGDETMHRHFLTSIADVEQHLALVFHRFMERTKRKVSIRINGQTILPWDPFLESHPATQSTPTETLQVTPGGATIVVKGFVLPHKDRLGDTAHAAASGPKGWNAQQGFYVYRNDRVIVAGSWLGLGGTRPWVKEEHYKLARIRLDIPNSMDHAWQLDVKKSSATPPPQLRKKLTGLAKIVRDRARDVYAHRGKYGKRSKRQEYEHPWKSVRRSGTAVYRIDRRHPLIEAFGNGVAPELRKEFENVLEIIERTVPIEQIWIDSAENSLADRHIYVGSEFKHVLRTLEISCAAIQRNRNVSRLEALDILASLEEFSDPESLAIIASLRDE